MTVLDLLKASRAALTEETWGQGHEPGCTVKGGRECAATMIERLSPSKEQNFHTVYPVADALGAIRSTVGQNVIEWNDTPGRTLAEVHAAFDKAIAKLEQESVA